MGKEYVKSVVSSHRFAHHSPGHIWWSVDAVMFKSGNYLRQSAFVIIFKLHMGSIVTYAIPGLCDMLDFPLKHRYLRAPSS